MPFIQRLFMTAQSSVLICMLAIAGVAQVQAAKPPPAGLAISAASWDGTTLSANGTAVNGKDGGGDVTVYDEDTDASLGSATPSRGGDGTWGYSGNTCADNIYAEQNGTTTDTFTVSGNGCGTPPVAQCSDGIDNDGDGLIDFPADPGCTDANDNDETDPLPPIDPGFADQTDFKIMMNYELGMHCTGFEFAYCCVLPAYNSILAQVVKPNTIDPNHSGDYARLMAGDPREGLDALGRETVVRDTALDDNGNFKKYVLEYWHDAQPRNDGRGKSQSSTLISAAEGNSLMSWNTKFDSVALDGNGKVITGDYNGAQGVVKGDGDTDDAADNYQNAVWNHLYFYENLEGDNSTGTSLEADKIRLGVNGHVVFPEDCGAALHPLGPKTSGGQSIEGDANSELLVDNTCAGFSNGNVLTFSGDKGTVVYTQMKVLENLPIMLTSPDIWEALGLPLTPFEDSVDFFSDPGLLDEDSVRPFVAMKAQMFDYDALAPKGKGSATLDSVGNPVIGFGTAPIDIPNCERCHSNPVDGTMIDNSVAEGGGQLMVVNSPNADPAQYAMVQAEYNYWNAYYNIDKAAGDSDWYSRLKSAAVSMLNGHDIQHGTSFAANYPGTEVSGEAPQNTRLGHESVICQRCHADNVIAAVKSASCGAGSPNPNDPSSCDEGDVIKPITEAIHNNHRGISTGGSIAFSDSLGRDGGCQGCHPAHRSDGDMNGYPITLAGANLYANGDNRGANGGCFVGRDVHSNPGKDSDGVETPAHLNAVGQYLADNVANDGNGIWCTNCHNQLGQEMWKTENMTNLVRGEGDTNPRAEPTLAAVAAAVGTTEEQAIAWLDPTDTNPLGDFTHAIWDTDPGLCDYVAGYVGEAIDPAHDGAVATVEVSMGGGTCSNEGSGTDHQVFVDCGFAAFDICGSLDGDGDFNVNLTAGVINDEQQSPFCTTPDCVAAAQATLNSPCNLAAGDRCAVPVPFSAATDGRDHWLSAGEPHCADCHAAPFVEQSGNINAYPPFNYPRKASLMRYSKGHQNISCQGCHESIHGLYPVTPNIDTTTYAQAAALNHDDSHGPLKCGTCHLVNGAGVPSHIQDGLKYKGQSIVDDYDAAVAWMHTFTAEADPLDDYCKNCHADGSNNSDAISSTNKTWTEHAFKGRSSREMMDIVELSQLGHVAGDPAFESPENTVCTSCHGDRTRTLSRRGCSDKWRNHLIEGRAAESVWEYVSTLYAGDTCGW